MTFSEDSFVAQMKALLPPGKAWKGPLIVDVLRGLAPELARIQLRADDILLEMTPGTATELLPEHENTYGIVPPPGATVAQRRAALLAKIQETAGHNPADYAAFAAAYGHPGVVITRSPLPPFRARNRAGDRLRGESWAHAYFMAYMAHLLDRAPNDVAGWGGLSATANFAYAPDETLTADRVSFPGTGAAGKFGSTNPTSGVQFSVWLRLPTGTSARPMDLFLARNSSPVGETRLQITVTDRWQRFEFRSTLALVDVAGFARRSDSGAAFDVYAWGGYAGAVDTTFESAFLNRQQAHAVPFFRVIGDNLSKD